MQKNKIGVGLITCDRKHFFEKSYKSLINASNKQDNCEIIIVNDGIEQLLPEIDKVINTTGKKGVGFAKNQALKHLIEQECEHIFLMEDDVEISDANVFNLYINAAKETGIKHFNFGLHGNHNIGPLRTPIIRKTINYPSNMKIRLYPNVLGAFSYYHIDTLNAVGLMDEQFYNALEHVDHTYQIIKAGYHPPFRWFADVEGAELCIKDVVPDHQESKIRSEDDFIKNFMENHERFMKKNNFSVISGVGTPENEYTEGEALTILKEIWKRNTEKSV